MTGCEKREAPDVGLKGGVVVVDGLFPRGGVTFNRLFILVDMIKSEFLMVRKMLVVEARQKFERGCRSFFFEEIS